MHPAYNLELDKLLCLLSIICFSTLEPSGCPEKDLDGISGQVGDAVQKKRLQIISLKTFCPYDMICLYGTI
jgi:hypothetical protein